MLGTKKQFAYQISGLTLGMQASYGTEAFTYKQNTSGKLSPKIYVAESKLTKMLQHITKILTLIKNVFKDVRNGRGVSEKKGVKRSDYEDDFRILNQLHSQNGRSSLLPSSKEGGSRNKTAVTHYYITHGNKIWKVVLVLNLVPVLRSDGP